MTDHQNSSAESAVQAILEGWFGEAIEHMDDEKRVRKFLLEPLVKAATSSDGEPSNGKQPLMASRPAPPVPSDHTSNVAQAVGMREAMEKARSFIELELDYRGPDVAGHGLDALNALDRALASQPSPAATVETDWLAKMHGYEDAPQAWVEAKAEIDAGWPNRSSAGNGDAGCGAAVITPWADQYNACWDRSKPDALKLAALKALNYIENTEDELGMKLSCGDALREALK